MQNHKQIENTIKLTTALKGLAQAYEEISVTKMQRVRGNVLSYRDYLDELSKVYSKVKQNYNQDITKLIKNKHGGAVTFGTGKNGKAVEILLSSNSKLHGDIGRKVFRYFLDHVNKAECDIYIIGKVGKDMYDSSGSKKKYDYTPFPETQQAQNGLMTFYELLERYDSVTVYYGQFINVLIQNPNISKLSGTTNLENNEKVEKVHFYFEPSLQSVLQFFENQIFTSLFRQTLHESQLAHDASRINQMESALQNIQDSQYKLTREKRRIKKRVENSKQIQRLLGRRLWR